MPVKVEFTRAAAKRQPDLMRLFKRTGGAIAFTLAKAIKARVSRKGDLGGQSPPPYASRSRRFVNPAYPRQPGAEEIVVGGDRFVSYKNSAEMHRGTRRGSYNVSGGMWSGLSVVVSAWNATLRFRGRSVGQSFGRKRFKTGKRKGEVRAPKPSNAQKAAAVFTEHGINLLALAEREMDDVEGGLRGAVSEGLFSIGPIAIEWKRDPRRSALEHQIIRAILAARG
jgi:hypothetical protein